MAARKVPLKRTLDIIIFGGKYGEGIPLSLTLDDAMLDGLRNRKGGTPASDSTVRMPLDSRLAAIQDGRDNDDPFHIEVTDVTLHFAPATEWGESVPHCWITATAHQTEGRVRGSQSMISVFIPEAALYEAPDAAGRVNLDAHAIPPVYSGQVNDVLSPY